MKKLLLSLLSMATLVSYAQNYHQTTTFGGTGIENLAASTLYQGNNLLTGGLYQPGTEVNGTTLPFYGGNADAYFIKYNEEGEIVMTKSFGGWADECITAITSDNEGNIYLTGYFQGNSNGGSPFDADPSDNVYPLNQPGSLLTRDCFIIKLTAEGDFIWAKQISNTEYGANEDANAIAVDNEGGLYIGGSFAQADFNTGGTDTVPNIVMTKSGQHEAFLVKLDAETGNFEWLHHWYGHQASFEDFVVDPATQSIVATGLFKKTMHPGTDSISLVNTGKYPNGFLTRIGFDGELEWVTNFGGEGYIIPNQLLVLENGEIVVGGQFNFKASFNPNDTSFVETKGQYDAWFSKFDAEGNFQFNKTFGGKAIEKLGSLQQDVNGNILASAVLSDTATFDTGAEVLEYNTPDAAAILLLSLNTDGEYLSDLYIEGGDGIGNLHAYVNTNGDVMMSGSFRGTVDFNPYEEEDYHTANGNMYDGFFSRFIWDAVTGIRTMQAEEADFSIFPNPVQDVINLSGDVAGSTYQLFNTSGKLIKNGTINHTTLPVSELQQGTYILKLETTAGAVGSRILIKQ